MDSRFDELRDAAVVGRHVRVVRLAQQLLEEPEGLSDAEAFTVARAGLNAAQRLQLLQVAIRFAERERELARAVGDSALQLTAQVHYGSMVLRLGDFALATDELERCLTLMATQPSGEEFRVPVLYNLGLACTLRRDYKGAVARFMEALDAAEQRELPQMQVQILLETAWVELLDGRPEPAGFHLERAQELLRVSPDESLQTTLLVHQAFYHKQVREPQASIDLCEEILARPDASAMNLSEAAWIAGECYLAAGSVDKADHLARWALDEARRAQWTAVINRANDLQRRVNEAGRAKEDEQGLG